MGISKKFLAALAIVCALAIVPVALGAGLKITTTPSHPRIGTKVTMKVSHLKPRERVKVVSVIPSSGQKNTYFGRAGSTGMLINTVRAQVKGRHNWTYTGMSSHRSGTTYYVVVK